MDQFILRQKELLTQEHEAEKAESASLLEGASVKELCHQGIAVQKLWISGRRTGLYGRIILTFCRGKSEELSSHQLSVGDIVAAILRVSSSISVHV